jgi:hypothetical protein
LRTAGRSRSSCERTIVILSGYENETVSVFVTSARHQFVRLSRSEQIAYGYRTDSERTDSHNRVDRQRALCTVADNRPLTTAISAPAFKEETKRNLICLPCRSLFNWGTIGGVCPLVLSSQRDAELTNGCANVAFHLCCSWSHLCDCSGCVAFG